MLGARLAAIPLAVPHREHKAATVVIRYLPLLVLVMAVAVVVLEKTPEMLVDLVVVAAHGQARAAVRVKDQSVE